MITASIVTYKTDRDELSRLLQCVENSSIDRLYVIDNSPTDDLRDFEGFSDKIEYTHGHGNIGYGSAHNIAMRRSTDLGATYHVVINPDILFSPGTIEGLTHYMDSNEDVGQVMPLIVYPNGETQYVCKLLPTPFDLIFKRFLPESWTRKTLNRFQLKFTGYDKEMNVPFLSGCFMFFRTMALEEIGYFDERFFMYCEDIDITRRMNQKYRTMFYPKFTVIHAHAAASRSSLKMLRVHIVNTIKYFNKWGWVFDSGRRKTNKKLLEELDAF